MATIQKGSSARKTPLTKGLSSLSGAEYQGLPFSFGAGVGKKLRPMKQVKNDVCPSTVNLSMADSFPMIDVSLMRHGVQDTLPIVFGREMLENIEDWMYDNDAKFRLECMLKAMPLTKRQKKSALEGIARLTEQEAAASYGRLSAAIKALPDAVAELNEAINERYLK